MKPFIPQPITAEHEELHEELVRATQAGGKVGPAAEEVARLLHQHFEAEEAYALPPLGYLAILAGEAPVGDVTEVLAMSRKLAAGLPQMLQEHGQIVAALKVLVQAATDDHTPEHLHFAEKLMLHAQTEEEILYPAAILVGKYLELTGARPDPSRQPEPARMS